MTQHQLFAISYFRIALIFKLIFSFRNEQVLKEIGRRITYIYIFAATLFVFTDLPYLVTLFITKLDTYDAALPMVSFLSITIILSFAIFRIRKFSFQLVQNKIFANESLMIVHLVAFTYLTVLNVATVSLVLAMEGSTDQPVSEMSTHDQRV